MYDVHARGYLILGLIAGAALNTRGADDPWIVRSVVWGVVLLVLSATLLAWTNRAP